MKLVLLFVMVVIMLLGFVVIAITVSSEVFSFGDVLKL